MTLVLSILGVLRAPFDASGDATLGLARLWAHLILVFSGVKVTVTSRTKLERDQPYVFMANHQSSADIWAVLVAVPVRLRFIAKKQLGRIPFLGWGMQAARFIFIDRTNAQAARRSIDEAKKRIRGGESVVLFPEGTRSRDGVLLPFKRGGFHLALDSEVPIVPIALVGTRAVMPKGALFVRARPVTVLIGEPIVTLGLTAADRHQLASRVRDAIAAMLREHGALPPEATQPQ